MGNYRLVEMHSLLLWLLLNNKHFALFYFILLSQHLFNRYISTSCGSIFEVSFKSLSLHAIHQLLPVGTKKSSHSQKVSDTGIQCLSFNDGICATGSEDGFIRLWPLDFDGPFMEAGRVLASFAVTGYKSCFFTSLLKRFQLMFTLFVFLEHEGCVTAIRVSTDGRMVSAGTNTVTKLKNLLIQIILIELLKEFSTMICGDPSLYVDRLKNTWVKNWPYVINDPKISHYNFDHILGGQANVDLQQSDIVVSRWWTFYQEVMIWKFEKYDKNISKIFLTIVGIWSLSFPQKPPGSEV